MEMRTSSAPGQFGIHHFGDELIMVCLLLSLRFDLEAEEIHAFANSRWDYISEFGIIWDRSECPIVLASIKKVLG
jgi:hypothetical protein